MSKSDTGKICMSMPFYECMDGVYEIDEFDCASIFVIEGEKKALVLDTGLGIGDLKKLIETRITDKPYELALSHNHGDHIGGLAWFERAYISPADLEQSDMTVSPSLEFRKSFAKMIRERSGKHYSYTEEDIRPWPKDPVFVPMEDGQEFDLGGRVVTAYSCPGHTPGEMVFIDSKTRTLFCGDAANEYFLLSNYTAPTKEERFDKAYRGLERIYGMSGKYDRVYNFHHDYRGFGDPLAEDVIPLILDGLDAMRKGKAIFEKKQDLLSTEEKYQTIVRSGRVVISSLDGDFDNH